MAHQLSSAPGRLRGLTGLQLILGLPFFAMHRLKNSHRLLLGVAGLLALFFVWRGLGYPSSLGEAYFYRKLSSEVEAGAQELKLAALMPGDWELVCGANGYGGDFHLKKYNRTYSAVGDLQDGAWGMIFISADGSFTAAKGSCRSAKTRLSLEGCHHRHDAVMRRQGVDAACPSFSSPGS